MEDIEVLMFDNLKEFLKTQDSPYILKFDLNDKESVYYAIVLSSGGYILALCIDENIKGDHIKHDGNKFVPIEHPAANSISLAIVRSDSILQRVLDEWERESRREERRVKKRNENKQKKQSV